MRRAAANGGGTQMSNAAKREALFGNRSHNPQKGMAYSASSGYTAAGGTGGKSSDHYAEQTNALFEEENNAQIDALHGKLQGLKALSIDIHGEVQEQNRLLDGMEDDFSSASGLMGKTLGKLQEMVLKGGSYNLCKVVAFSCFVFFVIWLIMKKR